MTFQTFARAVGTSTLRPFALNFAVKSIFLNNV